MQNLSPVSDEKDIVTKGYVDEVKSAAAINKSTLGYSGKNLFKLTISTQTQNGITFTVNDDKSITASGTQSLQTNTSYLTIGTFTAPFDGDYILTGYPTTDTSVDTNLGYLQYGATVIRNLEHKLTMSKGETIHLMLCVKAKCTLENRVFIPMVRLAEITDSTYEPYVPDVNTRLLALEDKHAQSGTLLASASIGSSDGDITIENLSAYSSAWAYIDGNSGVNFATNVIIPIAFLAKSTSNSVKIAGGIPSAAYITSSGPQAPADTSGYITASVSGNTLSLSLPTATGVIGNVMIVAM